MIKNNLSRKTNLIIGGGGLKGLCFLGALSEIFKIYDYKNFKSFSGCSIGSFIIVSLIIGYTIEDLQKFFIDVDLVKFTEYKLTNIFDIYGFDNGTKGNNLLKAIFVTKDVDPDITFIDFHEKFKKVVYIVGSNISKEIVEYFSHITHPNMKVIDALRISMAVPIMLAPFKYNGDFYVDGCHYESYPIEPFKNSKKNVALILDSKSDVEINSFNIFVKKLIYSVYNYIIKTKFGKNFYNQNDTFYIQHNEEIDGINLEGDIESKNNLFKMGVYSVKNIISNNIYQKILIKRAFRVLSNYTED